MKDRNRSLAAYVQEHMDPVEEPIPSWLSQQIDDLLAWDRELWDIDPPAGWNPVDGRFAADPPTT